MKFLIFNIKQTLVIGGIAHTIWFPPDYGEVPLEYRAGLRKRTEFESGQFYHKGDDVVKLKVSAGDHLFVDRLTYNFRKPERGEIVVFDTHGIDRLAPDQQNTFYIKRLVGLGGETLTLAPGLRSHRGTAIWRRDCAGRTSGGERKAVVRGHPAFRKSLLVSRRAAGNQNHPVPVTTSTTVMR